ncbi:MULTISPECIES: hypothetical protein [Streptococcus]|uniref:Uncharacterized protein n=1 Tax=Streptococcus dysgalactiae subsp. equisimilis TaxID=119602 RepID=A0AAE9U146_STREQ|nr:MULTISPECIES: hypothetical protein [Streptococcus]HEQ3639597.1 hypothetical protein [Streptococcus pyogenes]MDV6022208.1 hypothetical protein [Streptococcus canis]VTT17445.1 Uncharacterised protein [Streptococcus dysgalactiae]VTT23317.1 Uncharacterised protein [Streptococcus dysgalactiae subsp. equisimilis]GFE45950.1 hypothetical protein ScFU6_17190 [Streptococcus canis]
MKKTVLKYVMVGTLITFTYYPAFENFIPTINVQADTNKKRSYKKIDEKGIKKFSTYLKKSLREPMKEIGLEYDVTYIDTLLYIKLPQNAKYSDKTTTQKAVDNLLNFKNNAYLKWAKKNKYKYKKLKDFPYLYVEVEDGTVLAEEDGMSRTMKLK